MNFCPNFSDPVIKSSWDAITKTPGLGEFEARREFLRSAINEVPMRDPSAILKEKEDYFKPKSIEEQNARVAQERAELAKKLNDPTYSDPETLMGHTLLYSDIETRNMSVDTNSTTRANEFISKFTLSMPIDVQIVTPEEAAFITSDAKNPYDANINPRLKPAFFYGEKVYFIKGYLTTESVFHEFSHPIVKTIMQTNPSLFSSLVREAMAADPQLLFQAIAEYPDLEKSIKEATSEQERAFIYDQLGRTVSEEIVVKALTKAAMLKEQNYQAMPAYKKLITNILAAIKQVLRNIFGKIDLSKLNETTSLDEIAEMLQQGGNIKIDTRNVSRKDIVNYMQTASDYLDDIKNATETVGAQEMKILLLRAYEGATNQIKLILKNKNYQAMLDFFVDEFNRGDLQEIRSNIAAYAKDLERKTESLLEELERTEGENLAMVNSMLRLERMMINMEKQLRALLNDTDEKDALGKAFYYGTVITYWEKYIEDALSVFRKADADERSSIMILLKAIDGHMKKSTSIINEINKKDVEKIIYEEWEPMAERAREKFHHMIKTLKDRGASQAKINKEFISFYGLNEAEYDKYMAYQKRLDEGKSLSSNELTEYETLKKQSLDEGMNITKEKINRALVGQGKDVNYMNGFFEGYLYNTDPIIGGFAMFYKRNMTEMQVRAQARYNDIVNELQPLIKEAGISFAKIGELGTKIGFIDTIAVKDDKGNIVPKKVWTLLNKWKDYRYDVDKYKIDIEELRIKWAKSGNEADRAALVDAIAERKLHMSKWFYQDYIDEYYKRDEAILADPIGRLAYDERARLIDKLKEVDSPLNKDEDYEVLQARKKELLRQYRNLYSLTNLDGSPKTDSFEKDGKTIVTNNLTKAKLLIDHRDKTRKFFESKLRPGVFQSAYKNYENKVYENLKKSKVYPGTPEFNALLDAKMDEWVKKNTRKIIKPEFYQEKARLVTKLKEILNRPVERLKADIARLEAKSTLNAIEKDQLQELRDYLNDAEEKRKKLDFTDAYTTILNIVGGYKDEDGQPNGNEIMESALDKIKESQKNIINAKKEWAGNTGLTVDEMDELQNYRDKVKKSIKLNKTESQRFGELIRKRKVLGLSASDNTELFGIFDDLSELQSEVPTVYYLDRVNQFLDEVNDPEVYSLLNNLTELDESNIDLLYNPEVLTLMYDKSPAFATWFKKNHIVGQEYVNGEYQEAFKRLMAWNIIVPNDSNYYEKTKVVRADGTEKEIDGAPSYEYYSRVVKKEYRVGYDPVTQKVKKIVGVHIDNQGEPLPKDVEGSPYINEKYKEMEAAHDANPSSEQGKLFKVLQSITKHHLKNQEGLSARNKLYLDFPRYEMSTLEKLQTTTFKKGIKRKTDPISRMIKKIRDFFEGARYTGDSSFNWEDQKLIVRAASYNDHIDNIPIQGLYDLELEETSTDIITGMFRYLYSAEHHKQLVKINPIAKGLYYVLNDPNNKIKEKSEVQSFLYKNFGILSWLNKKDKYVRAEAFSNFYDREFLGKNNTGFGKDDPWVLNAQKALMSGASTAFFAFNIPSALKNAMGQKFQGLIMAAGGKDLNFTSYIKAEAFSTRFMMKLSAGEAYKQGVGSLENQLVEVFDPSQGRFEEKFGTQFTRTIFKDVASKGILFNFRKWTELQASIQVFGGMMHKQKIPFGDSMIEYADAWELNADGKIQLKAGIDAEWGITYDEEGKPIVGRKFVEFRNRVHMVMNKLNGAYSKFDQPEAQRYLAFRFVSFLRRYFTSMAVHRFGKRRWNPGYGEIDEGYWLSTMKAFVDVIRTRNLNDITDDQKAAIKQVMFEFMAISMFSILLMALFGWDEDDEERYEKIRQRSGALPIPGTIEDVDHEFNIGGFIGLHMMNLMMQVQSENEQFIPFPGYGFDNMKSLLDLKSLAFGPTIDTYGRIAQDFVEIVKGSDKQFYTRRVGAFEWQNEGGRKLFAHIAKMFGVTGSNIDPGQMIINFQKAKQLNLYK